MQKTWFYGPLFKLKLLFIQSEMQKKKGWISRILEKKLPRKSLLKKAK